MRAGVAASLGRLAVTALCGALAGACALFGGDDLSELQRALVEKSYARFLHESFPADAAGYLSVQSYREDPSEEDLELSFTLLRDGRGERRIRLVVADGDPVYRQLQRLVNGAPDARPDELVGRVHVKREEFAVAACPDLSWIEESWSSEWLLTRLPAPNAAAAVLRRPAVVRMEVRDANRSTAIETWDEGEPAFRWAREAARRVRRCLEPD